MAVSCLVQHLGCQQAALCTTLHVRVAAGRVINRVTLRQTGQGDGDSSGIEDVYVDVFDGKTLTYGDMRWAAEQAR